MDIGPGDIVRIKGQELEMVVSHTNAEKTHARCYWMSTAGGETVIKNDGLPVSILELLFKAEASA